MEWSQNDEEGNPNICNHPLIPGPRDAGEAVPATSLNPLPYLKDSQVTLPGGTDQARPHSS